MVDGRSGGQEQELLRQLTLGNYDYTVTLIIGKYFGVPRLITSLILRLSAHLSNTETLKCDLQSKEQ